VFTQRFFVERLPLCRIGNGRGPTVRDTLLVLNAALRKASPERAQAQRSVSIPYVVLLGLNDGLLPSLRRAACKRRAIR
jgi:hypothetical protein